MQDGTLPVQSIVSYRPSQILGKLAAGWTVARVVSEVVFATLSIGRSLAKTLNASWNLGWRNGCAREAEISAAYRAAYLLMENLGGVKKLKSSAPNPPPRCLCGLLWASLSLERICTITVFRSLTSFLWSYLAIILDLYLFWIKNFQSKQDHVHNAPLISSFSPLQRFVTSIVLSPFQAPPPSHLIQECLLRYLFMTCVLLL